MKMNLKIQALTSELIALAENNGLENTYSLFIPFIGEMCNERPVVFVGRDTRGNENVISTIDSLNCYQTEELGWLKKGGGYRYTKSPFWRVVLKAISSFNEIQYGYEAHKRICWSNLYRVSPKGRKKTPDNFKKLQLNICSSLFLEEIKSLRPLAVVFLTGYEIDPFYRSWNIAKSADDLVSLDCVNVKSFNFYVDDNCVIPALVCDHPQSKVCLNEDEIIWRVNAFLKARNKYGEDLGMESKYYRRHIVLRDILNAGIQNLWSIYRSNDLTISAEIGAYHIGIESAFSHKNFSYYLTSWDAASKKFLLGELYDLVQQKLGADLVVETRERNKKRADILFSPIDVSWDEANEASENEKIAEALLKVHCFLIDQRGNVEKYVIETISPEEHMASMLAREE